MSEEDWDKNRLWATIHAERAALVEDLAGLDQRDWEHPTLCGQWSVREVVAHLTAAASTGMLRWITSMAGARFNPAVHNQRRLSEHLGATPQETLDRFRAVVTSSIAPAGNLAAWLGEVVVHAQDIRRPLGIATTPALDGVTEVARFFVSRDFAVNSKRAAQGLRLEATDGPFQHGAGPLARGTTLAIVMAVSGRTVYCDDLTGPGAGILRERVTPEA